MSRPVSPEFDDDDDADDGARRKDGAADVGAAIAVAASAAVRQKLRLVHANADPHDVESTPPAPPAPPASPDAPSTTRRWLARLLPVGSLLTATATAVWMERDAARASLVGGVALLGWLVVAAAALVVRRIDAREALGDVGRRHRAARFVALFVSQTALQQALAFPLPFVARATTSASGGAPAAVHLPFLGAYAVALVVVGWDPAWAAVVRRPALVMAVQAFAAFTALIVALPMLGVDNATSTRVAGAVVGVAVVAGALLVGARRGADGDAQGGGGRGRGVVVAGAVGVALLVALTATLGARFVPPAPLALGPATFALDVQDREPRGAATSFVRPPVLWCHTAIRAPLGLRDQLVHVWRRDGHEVARIPLVVAGGTRAAGFRTWSRLRQPAAGAWECRVETAIGQRVGAVTAVVVDDAPATAPARREPGADL